MLLNCKAHLFSYLYIIVWSKYNKILCVRADVIGCVIFDTYAIRSSIT